MIARRTSAAAQILAVGAMNLIEFFLADVITWGGDEPVDRIETAGMLADADGAFTKAIGMNFDAPAVGFYGRSKRYALAAQDGVVTVWHPEPERGCSVSGGEAMLAAL